jgi:hypothetical protein
MGTPGFFRTLVKGARRAFTAIAKVASMRRHVFVPLTGVLVATLSGCASLLGAVGLDNSADVCDELDKIADDTVTVVLLGVTNPLAFDVYAEELSSQAESLRTLRPTNPELRDALVDAASEMTELLDLVRGTNETGTVGDVASRLAGTQLAITELNSLCETARQ